MSVLDEILQTKKAEIGEKIKRFSFDEIKDKAASFAPRGFKKALLATSNPAIIAEIKRASPSKGDIRPDLDIIQTALSYKNAGAACLSILTDEKYFKGKLEFISDIRNKCSEIPILRKDFIIDEYQVFESRAAGADAILLIVAALTKEKLTELLSCAEENKLDVLLEVHTEEELEIAKEVSADKNFVILGINNRDLKTFKTDLEVTNNLCKALDNDFFVVSESGIETARDIQKLTSFGAKAFLIGESLVRKGDPGENLQTLIDEARA